MFKISLNFIGKLSAKSRQRIFFRKITVKRGNLGLDKLFEKLYIAISKEVMTMIRYRDLGRTPPK